MFFQTSVNGVPRFRKAWYIDRNPLGETVKRRLLYKPNDAMREVHRSIIAYCRTLREKHISSQIAPVRLSPLRNVGVHRSARYFLLFDLHHAYPSVDLNRMVEVLLRADPELAGKELLVYDFLRRYCFADEGGLAVGAPASPDLFNLYAGFLLDEPLWDILKDYAAKKQDTVRYSRYLDDLTISLTRRQFGSSIRWRIRQVVKRAGFRLHRRKSRQPLDIRKGPITFTGLRLEQGGRIFIPRHYLQLFRKRLRYAIENRVFEGDVRIEKLAGMYGVFWSGIPRDQELITNERDIVRLWNMYRKFRKQHLGPSHQ